MEKGKRQQSPPSRREARWLSPRGGPDVTDPMKLDWPVPSLTHAMSVISFPMAAPVPAASGVPCLEKMWWVAAELVG